MRSHIVSVNGTRQTSAHTRSHFLFPVYHNAVCGLVTDRWLFADVPAATSSFFLAYFRHCHWHKPRYSISRSIFPLWTVDFLQLMSPGLIWFNWFDWIKHYQRQTIFLITDPLCLARTLKLIYSIKDSKIKRWATEIIACTTIDCNWHVM